MPEEGLPSDEGRVHGIDAEGIDTDEWNQLMRHLEATIPVYDKVNSIVTLGQDSRWRRHVAKSAQPGMKVLEVGCGPGTFAEHLTGVDLTCLDPSAELLAVAKKRIEAARLARSEDPASYVAATAESIPLDDDSFDRVFCLFSFRDFHDKNKGLTEILRVLKPGGKLVICDAGKGRFPHGLLGRLWMATVVQVVARIVTKNPDHPWKWLAKTYVHFGTIPFYRKMMREVGYENIRGRLLLPFLMAGKLSGEKPKDEGRIKT
jgi:demethylmenaquinone methyltransferase/2-methoxy-6-polyprenyl-1,4-benzoquinol methylase